MLQYCTLLSFASAIMSDSLGSLQKSWNATMNEDAPNCRLDWIESTFGRVPSTTRDLRWREGYAGLVRTSEMSAFRKASKEVDDVLDRVASNTKKYDDELLAGRSVVLPGDSTPTKLPEHIVSLYRKAGFSKKPVYLATVGRRWGEAWLDNLYEDYQGKDMEVIHNYNEAGEYDPLLENTRVPG